MDQHHPGPALGQSGGTFPALRHVTERPSGGIARRTSVVVLSEPAFGPSHSHRIWRMMNALIDAMPEWADAEAFGQARETMLQFGLSKGMTLEELYALSDPDVILGLWTAAEAKDVEV
jgi:hypothetical protein